MSRTIRTLEVRGKYQNTPAILTYTGESTTVWVDPIELDEDSTDAERQEAAAYIDSRRELQAEADEEAAERITKDYFFRRAGITLSWKLIDNPSRNTTLHSTKGLEDLLEPEVTETGD